MQHRRSAHRAGGQVRSASHGGRWCWRGVDTAGLDAFSDDAVCAPEVVALRDRVQVLLVPQCSDLTLSEVVIETQIGTVLRQRHDSGRLTSHLLGNGSAWRKVSPAGQGPCSHLTRATS